MKIKDATFASAVRMQDKKIQNFVSDKTYDLFYNTDERLLYVRVKNSSIVKLIGITNIQEMTAEITEKKTKKDA